MIGAQDVLEIYAHLSAHDIRVWLVGGWGVDALLGEQTRSHKDLDVVMLLDDVARMKELLGGCGFELKDLWPENRWAHDSRGNKVATAFVLQDASGRELDVHAMCLDDRGNGIPAWDEAEDFSFKEQDLAGRGTIAGVAVHCITPASQMRCHTGYELGEKDLHDLNLLHTNLGVEYPDGYPSDSAR